MNSINLPHGSKKNYNFEKVDIFLRVKGRLPQEKGDGCTKEIMIEYCEKYEAGKLTTGIVPLDYMFSLCKQWLLEDYSYSYKDVSYKKKAIRKTNKRT